MTENRTYTVSEMNRLVRELVEGSGAVANIQVRGEISNFKRYPSGHCYFSLKDDSGVLKCVMFRNQAMRLTKFPENGDTVIAVGSIRVYERDGVYQLYVDLMKAEGTGSLMQAYEKLRNKLAAEGLFADERKKPLPVFPRTVGIITSPAGAAVRDIITVSRRRDPGIRLLLYPVSVQGKSASAEIAFAIGFMNRHRLADVLIVGRGGGSMEDLWAFNEEAVVRAVAASEIPVVSSVGHETDITLSDFAADKRAATPSHAAELVVADTAQYRRLIEKEREKLLSGMNRLLKEKRLALQRVSENRMLRSPLRIFERPEERLDRAMMRLRQTLPNRLQNRELRLRQAVSILRHPEKYLEQPERHFLMLQKALKGRRHFFDNYERNHRQIRFALDQGIRDLVERKDQQLKVLSARMDAVSPLKVLARGYSMTLDENGKLLKSVDGLQWGGELHTKLNDGDVWSVIQQIERRDENGG